MSPAEKFAAFMRSHEGYKQASQQGKDMLEACILREFIVEEAGASLRAKQAAREARLKRIFAVLDNRKR